MVVVETVRAGSVLSFPFGSVVITIIRVHTGVFVSPSGGIVGTNGNVLVVHIGVVEIHVVQTLLSEPNSGPEVSGGALLFWLVPAYTGIHPPEVSAPREQGTSLHLCPLCSPNLGIKHDINQSVFRRVRDDTVMVVH